MFSAMSDGTEDRPGSRQPFLTSRSTRVVAGTVAVAVGVSSALLFGGAGAASASTPRAQSVGRFLDGAAGGTALEKVLDVKDARATNPGTVTDQNPLAVSLGGQMTIPLTGALKLPGSGNAVHLGAVNQVAVAKSDGYAYGASGAVSNSGGASVGGNDNAYPANATLDLTPAALGSIPSIPVPGAPSADALGAITAKIGAVSALASTPKGTGKKGTTRYAIGSVDLTIGSPALGALLSTLQAALNPAALQLPSLPLPVSLPALPQTCDLSKVALPSSLSIDDGAVTISATDGTINVSLTKLLAELGLNINSLPANTDLLAYLTKYLSSVNGLSAGIQKAIGGLTSGLQDQFTACAQAVPGATEIISALQTGQSQLTTALNALLGSVSGAAGGSGNPLAPLADGLKQAVQIGVNVQPNGRSGSYSSPLKATPDQATDPINGQTIVRAIEVDLGGGQLALALANAAAGPSSAVAPEAAATTPTTSSPATPAVTHNSVIPTGVPAGEGTRGGTPTLPLVLLALGLLLGGAGALGFGLRRVRFGRHGG